MDQFILFFPLFFFTCFFSLPIILHRKNLQAWPAQYVPLVRLRAKGSPVQPSALKIPLFKIFLPAQPINFGSFHPPGKMTPNQPIVGISPTIYRAQNSPKRSLGPPDPRPPTSSEKSSKSPKIQDKFDHDKGQKSAISGRRLHWRLSTGFFLLFLQYLCAI